MRTAILSVLVVIGLLFLGVFFFYPTILPEFLQPLTDETVVEEETGIEPLPLNDEQTESSKLAVTQTEEPTTVPTETLPPTRDLNAEPTATEPATEADETETEDEEINETPTPTSAPARAVQSSATPVPQSPSVSSVVILDNENGEPIITAAVRRGPNLDYRVIDLIYPNTRVNVIGQFGSGASTWYFVETPNGNQGWISVVVARPN